jgi:hypothetical protein
MPTLYLYSAKLFEGTFIACIQLLRTVARNVGMMVINNLCRILESRKASRLPTQETTRHVRRFRCIFLFLAALFVTSAPTAKGEMTSAAGSFRERIANGFSFTASSRRVAFQISAPERGFDLLLVDLESKSVKKLRSPGAKLLSPFLSADGNRLLVVRLRNDTAEYELLSCRTVDFSCTRLIASKESIVSPTEINADQIVYVASPLRVIPGVRSSYVDHDFWLLEAGKQPRQLTDFRFYELHSLSITLNGIYFSAIGGQRNAQIIPKFEPTGSTVSDIFKLPFDSTRGTIESPRSVLTPLFLAREYQLQPAYHSMNLWPPSSALKISAVATVMIWSSPTLRIRLARPSSQLVSVSLDRLLWAKTFLLERSLKIDTSSSG